MGICSNPVKDFDPEIYLNQQTLAPTATKLGRVVIYFERVLPIKSHDLLIT